MRRQLPTGQVDCRGLVFLKLNEKRLKDKELVINQLEEPTPPTIDGRFIGCQRQVVGWKSCLLDHISPLPFVGYHQIGQFMMDLFALRASQPSDNEPSGFTTFIS